jgi:argininosuccinate lyase
MMPQKRNPDVFELIRGKSGRAVGNLTHLLVTTKGLPGGYNRDLQEDRAPLLETGPHTLSVIETLRLALGRVRFDKERCLAALMGDYTQATDLAESLALRGIPFRTAYQAVGSLVRKCQEQKIPLAQVTEAEAQKIHPLLDAQTLKAVQPKASVERKQNPGGTGPESVKQQIADLKKRAADAQKRADQTPRLSEIFTSLKEIPF